MRQLIICIAMLLSFVTTATAQLNTDRLVSVGRNALYFDDYLLSIQYFNQAIKAKPFLVDPYFYRAIAKIQLDDYIGAEKDLDIVIDRNPFIPMAFYARGYSLKRQARWLEAEADFTKALEFSPDNDLYIINRIEIYQETDRINEALLDIDALLRRTPKSLELNYEKGRLLLLNSDTISAIRSFEYLTEIDSLNSEAWAARGYANLLADDNTQALRSYNIAVRLHSTNPSTYMNRGIINYRNNNYRGAMSDYDRAVELAPDNDNARFNRALLNSEVGNYNVALSDLNSIIKSSPNFYEAVFERANISSKLGDVKQAIDDYSSIINQFPLFIPAYYSRAEEYEKLGKNDLAFYDRDEAYKLREKQRNGDNSNVDTINTSMRIASTDGGIIKNRAAIFSANTNSKNSKQGIRGAIQDRDITLENLPNYLLSYYKQSAEHLQGSSNLHYELQKFNSDERLQKVLYLINNEVKLSQGMMNYHFESIDKVSSLIAQYPEVGELYLSRGYDHALIQDFSAAIEDLSKAIFYGDSMELAYFTRANLRYKQLEFTINNRTNLTEIEDSALESNSADYQLGGDIIQPTTVAEQQYRREFEMIMRDYDKVIELLPDFPYSWYNRANMLVIQQDFKSAIKNYTNAIRIKNDFGEAYYNRALTYIYIGEYEKGIADLSKAGELGIYQAYSALKKVQSIVGN